MPHLQGLRPGEVKVTYTNTEVLALIKDRIHSARDRKILRDRLVHGMTYEQLAEAHDLSVRQVKRIVYRGQDIIFK